MKDQTKTKKYKDLLNRFLIKISREDYLNYVEWDFGLNKQKKDDVLLDKFNQLKTQAENDEFIYVAIGKLVRPYQARVKDFKKKQLDLYTHLITFISEKNGINHGLRQQTPSVYMIDTQNYNKKIAKIIDII
ncbi:MAG: hypothetical protein EBT12_16600 [Marivivens sp.]|nr:hypothetical protein [Marivivens sp.]